MNKKDSQLAIAILLVVLWFAYCSCAGSKKSAEEKAYEARQAEIALIKKARDMFPCDTQVNVTIKVDTTFQYFTKDTVIYFGNDNEDSIVYINKYHTIEKVVDRIQTVIDRAEVQAARDSIDNISFLWEAAVKANADSREEISKYEKKVSSLNLYKGSVIGMGVLILLLIILIIYRRLNPVKII